MNYNFFGKLRKEGKTLVYVKKADDNAYEAFKKSIPEGSIVEFYVEVVTEDGNLPQLRKCHAMIRELANHTGYTMSEIKLIIKEKSGLCLSRTKAGKEYFICKSLGDCSKQELSDAIKACIELGEEVNHPLT